MNTQGKQRLIKVNQSKPRYISWLQHLERMYKSHLVDFWFCFLCTRGVEKIYMLIISSALPVSRHLNRWRVHDLDWRRVHTLYWSRIMVNNWRGVVGQNWRGIPELICWWGGWGGQRNICSWKWQVDGLRWALGRWQFRIGGYMSNSWSWQAHVHHVVDNIWRQRYSLQKIKWIGFGTNQLNSIIVNSK